jgi:hypothetical protein
MPQDPVYRWRDYETGETGEMPWSSPNPPSDQDIDLYKYQRANPPQSWGDYARSWIPDPIENAWSSAGNAWNYLNEPTSTAPSRTVDEFYKASGGRPLSMPLMGYNVPIPESVGRFMGGMADDQTSLLNIGLNVGTLGGYAGARAGLSGLTNLGRMAARGEMLAGGIGAGSGAVNMLNAETPSDYGTAALQMGLGAFGLWGGKGDLDAFNAPRPMPDPFAPAPGTITDPARLLPEAASGARFEAGTGGVRDFQSPSPDVSAPLAGTPPLMDLEMPAPSPAAAVPDLQMRTVNPRGPSNLQPFEQDASIFQQMRQEPVLGDMVDPGIGARPQVPQVEQFGPSPGPPPPRTVLGRPIGDAAADIARMDLEPPGPVGPHPDDLAAVTGDIETGQAGVPDVDSPALQEATMSAMADEATPISQMSVEELVANSRPKVNNPPLPPPVRPARDAIARVAAVAEQAPTPKPLVRPAVPKAPTPDRVIRIGRGVKDAIKATFPDKLHVDLFSAIGRSKRIMRGEKNVPPPDYESIAQRLGVSVKDAQRISSEYRQKVQRLANEAPGLGPEGYDYVDMEMPHWGGKTEMVTAPPTPEPVAAIASTPEVAPELPPPTVAELTAVLKSQGAKPVKPPVVQQAKLPKSKNARVAAVMDELTTLGTATIQDISNDPARLRSAAKAAGIKPDTLKSAIQEWFKKAGGSETGALNITIPTKAQLGKGFEKTFDAANSVRMTSMLSGLAFPKSLAGNIGAHLAAALEGRTLKPLKVLADVKSISRDLKSGWQSGANPALVTGFNKANLPGRAMGAFDFAGIESLKRAGLSEKDAKELMLTGANQISSWWPLETRAGKYIVPFRTTPFNQFAQGITRWKKHPEVYAAAVALGALSGANVEDKEGLAMLSAFAGPYAIPFIVGAWVASGKAEVLNSISPIPEWGITKSIINPFAPVTESPGLRWTRSNLGFGKQAAKEKKLSMGRKVGSTRRRGSRGSRASR